MRSFLKIDAPVLLLLMLFTAVAADACLHASLIATCDPLLHILAFQKIVHNSMSKLSKQL